MNGVVKLVKHFKESVKYNCIIVDDSPLDRNITSVHVNRMNMFDVVALCSDGVEAAAVLKKGNIDVVFSDIDMPVLSGTELLKGLKNPPVFIFISAHSKFAVETYDLDAVDFIVKPIKFERLFQAANKAVDFIELRKLRKEKDSSERSDNTEQLQSPAASDDYFFINQMRGITRLRYSDVIFVESMNDSSVIHTVNDEKFTVLVNLKNLAEQIPDALFKRVHRRFIVNMDHIEHIFGNTIRLDTKHTLQIGELYRKDIMQQLGNKKVVGRHLK